MSGQKCGTQVVAEAEGTVHAGNAQGAVIHFAIGQALGADARPIGCAAAQVDRAVGAGLTGAGACGVGDRLDAGVVGVAAARAWRHVACGSSRVVARCGVVEQAGAVG